MSNGRLILASASPRRRELLTQIGLRFEVVVTDVDESRLTDESPDAYVERLAISKARAGHRGDGVAIGSDTIVLVGDEILGKPGGPKEGKAMLQRLSGRPHQVKTGVAVYDSKRTESVVVTTQVMFRDISEAEIDAYVQTGEGRDKAGGYGIQGIGSIFASSIEGSYSAVVGLPLAETEALLRMLNVDTWRARIDV